MSASFIALVLLAQSDIPAADLRCGSYCLFLGLKSLNLPVGNYEEFEARLGQPTRLGYSMQQLSDGAALFGAHTLAVDTSLSNLQRRRGRFACIALLEQPSHYVCIYDLDDKFVYIANPPKKSRIERDAFTNVWGGRALLLSDRPLAPVSRGWPLGIAGAGLGLVVLSSILARAWIRSSSRGAAL